MIRTFKYRLYPHARQAKRLHYLLALSRNVYNAALEQRIAIYKETGAGVTYKAQSVHFGNLRRADYDGLGLLNFSSMQHTLRRLDKAYRAFFRRIKAGNKPGFPRFKGTNRWDSFEFTYGDGCKLRFDERERALLYIQNVGEIKVKYHREIPVDAKIKHAIVKRSLGKWYVSLDIELPDPEIADRPTTEIGIDAGLHSLLALSDGTLIDNPRWLRTGLAELRVKQRRLSRRKKGSRNRCDAAFQVAATHEHIANQRRDFWHKSTRDLVDAYSLIAIEDLTLGFMTRNHHLALSASDAGLGLFRQLLESKAEEAGSRVVAVHPAYTSQMCSGCCAIVPKDLSVRVHQCPHCNLALDRDVNAAINILNLARTGPSGLNVGDGSVRVPRSSPL
jgi:putative transposase